MGRAHSLSDLVGKVEGEQAAEQPPQPRPATPESQDGKRTRNKVGFYQDPNDSARMRAAFIHTRAETGTRSLSAFIDQAVMAEVRRLERTYNEGQPWGGVHAGTIPPGPPVSE